MLDLPKDAGVSLYHASAGRRDLVLGWVNFLFAVVLYPSVDKLVVLDAAPEVLQLCSRG